MSGPKITVLTDTSGEAKVKRELNDLNREFARLELAGRDANRTLSATGGATDRFSAGIKAAAGPGGLQGLSAGLMSVAPQAAAVVAGLAAAKKEAEEFAGKSRVLSDVLRGLKGDQDGLTDSVARFVDQGERASGLNVDGEKVGGFIGTALGGPQAWLDATYSEGIDLLTESLDGFTSSSMDAANGATLFTDQLRELQRQEDLRLSSENAAANKALVDQWNRETIALRAQREEAERNAAVWKQLKDAKSWSWIGLGPDEPEPWAGSAQGGRGGGRGGRRQGPRTAELFELGSGRSTGPQWGGGGTESFADMTGFAAGIDVVTAALGELDSAMIANAESAEEWAKATAEAHEKASKDALKTLKDRSKAEEETNKAMVSLAASTVSATRTSVAGFLAEGAPKENFLGASDIAMAGTATAQAVMGDIMAFPAIGLYLASAAQHFYAASQAGKGGGGARSSIGGGGGGGGGSSRPIAPAPVPRERSQSPAETILQLMVDDRVLGEVAARGNNRALAMGRGEALDSRLIGRARRGGI